jgi:hypothetical protein
VNKVGKQPKGKTRSYEEKSKPKVSIQFSSVGSPVSVEGKSPCGQVDLLKEIDS